MCSAQNFNVVLSQGNPKSTGIHWAQSQATMIRNVSFTMGTDAQTAMFMENGSGGFISDVTVSGGQTGLSLGNQQWTFRSARARYEHCVAEYDIASLFMVSVYCFVTKACAREGLAQLQAWSEGDASAVPCLLWRLASLAGATRLRQARPSSACTFSADHK